MAKKWEFAEALKQKYMDHKNRKKNEQERKKSMNNRYDSFKKTGWNDEKNRKLADEANRGMKEWMKTRKKR